MADAQRKMHATNRTGADAKKFIAEAKIMAETATERMDHEDGQADVASATEVSTDMVTKTTLMYTKTAQRMKTKTNSMASKHAW